MLAALLDTHSEVATIVNECQLEEEPLKMLGSCDGQYVNPADIGISAHCNRVAVSDGHIVCVTAELGQLASTPEIITALQSFTPSQACLLYTSDAADDTP